MYEFDVFIAHDEKDWKFVREYLVPILDKHYEGCYSCCIEDRNFMPGAYRTDCICEALQKSHVTLLVLSRNYLEQGFGRMVSYLAFRAQLEARRLLPLRIDNCETPAELEPFIFASFNWRNPSESQELILKAVEASISPSAAAALQLISGSTSRSPLRLRPSERGKTIRTGTNDLSDGLSEFNKKPQEWLKELEDANRESPYFKGREQLILCDVLHSNARNSDICPRTLSFLCCCVSYPVKEKALCWMENRLSKMNYTVLKYADGLLQAEKVLRCYICDGKIKEDSPRIRNWMLRVYGHIIFTLALQMEKNNLSHFQTDLVDMKKVLIVLNSYQGDKGVSGEMTYCLMFVKGAFEYFFTLCNRMNSAETLRQDGISEKLSQLCRIETLRHFKPWRYTDSSLNTERNWFQMDVLLASIGSQAFDNGDVIYVILGYLELLLTPRASVSECCQLGMLVNVARLLARICVTHPREEYKTLAYAGTSGHKSFPALRNICELPLWKKHHSFGRLLREIISPLLFMGVTRTIAEDILNRYYVEMVSTGCLASEKSLNEKEIYRALEPHMVQCYLEDGYTLSGFGSNISRNRQYDVYVSELNGLPVALRLPRMKETEVVIEHCVNSEGTPLAKELKYLSKLRHCNILKLGVFPVCSPLHVITEHCNKGGLDLFLQNNHRSGRLSSKSELLDLLLQVSRGVEHIHRQHVVHRAICAKNVFLSSRGDYAVNCKLAGFDLALDLPGQTRSDVVTTGCLSQKELTYLRWLPRESLVSSQWSTLSDVSMLAGLAQELFTGGSKPYSEFPITDDVRKAMTNKIPPLQFPCVPSDVQECILHSRCPDQNKRYCVQKFIRDVDAMKHSSETKPNFSPPSSWFPSALTCGKMPLSRCNSAEAESHSTEVKTVHASARESNDEKRGQLVRVLGKLDHKNLMLFLTRESDTNLKSLAWGWTGIDILDYIDENKHRITMTSLLDVMVQLALVLKYLHEKHLVLCTLTPENISVDAVDEHQGYLQIKLGGFGNCQLIEYCSLDAEGRTDKSNAVPRKALSCAAPEVMNDPAFYSRASDVYSYAMVCWSLVATYFCSACTKTFTEGHEKDAHRKTASMKSLPGRPEVCPRWLYLLWLQCWRHRLVRPTMDLILQTLRAQRPCESSLLTGLSDYLPAVAASDIVQGDTLILSPPSESSHEYLCLDWSLQESRSYYTDELSKPFVHNYTCPGAKLATSDVDKLSELSFCENSCHCSSCSLSSTKEQCSGPAHNALFIDINGSLRCDTDTCSYFSAEGNSSHV